MAWDWNRSGRIDSFSFDKVSSSNLNTTLGSLGCLVTGGTLNYSYYSDLKVSGSLEVINAPSSMSQDQYLIRIWYCPALDGVKQKIELGTFYFTANLHYENGMYKGTLELRSLLARHIDDLTYVKWTISKGITSSASYKAVFKYLGGFPSIKGITDKKFNKIHVFDVGVPPMQILQYIADYCGGQITVDAHGRTVLQNYESAANKKKHITHIVSANNNSVLKPGLQISNSIKEIPNRVVCVYDESNGKKTKQYVGKAALAGKEARSFAKTGKWVTRYYKITNCKKPYVKNLQAKAKAYLANLNHKTVYYEFDTYYQPIQIGQVITLKYDNITVNGLVTDIDLSLSIGASMHVKIRKV